jgi:endonuclease/exonuclease/phosphatase family metal-dependent hydrolase
MCARYLSVFTHVAAWTTAALLESGCISSHLPSSDPELSDDALSPGCRDGAGPRAMICPATRACDPSAATPKRVRIVDWNIKAGTERGLEAVLDTLRALDPDVVLLQEVDYNAERTARVSQPEVLARALGRDYQYVFAPTMALEGGLYGIAALSRLPFRAVGLIALTNTDNAEPRTVIDARLCAGQSQLRVLNHHADYMKEGAAQSCSEILEALSEQRVPLTVFAGDLNQGPAEPGPTGYLHAGFHDVLADRDARGTFGSDRIDYFFADDELAARVVAGQVVRTRASDHNAIVMDVQL